MHKEQPIVNSVKKCDLKSVETLLKNGTSPDTVIDEITGETLLIYSIIKKMLPIQQLLLNYGANPNLCDKSNNSPLYYSLKYYNNNSVALLATYQANTEKISSLTDKVLKERGRSANDKIPDTIVYLSDMVKEYQSEGIETHIVSTVEENVITADLKHLKTNEQPQTKSKKL